MRYFQPRGSDMKGKKSSRRSAGNSPRGNYVFDKRLVPRIQEYMRQSHKKTINISEMAETLQSMYSEYGRRKINTFRMSVEKAYKTLCQQRMDEEKLQKLEERHMQKKSKLDFSGMGDESAEEDEESALSIHSTDSEIELDDEPVMEVKHTNSMNQSMQMMYRASSRAGSENEQELAENPPSLQSSKTHSEQETASAGEASKQDVQEDKPMKEDDRGNDQTPSTPLKRKQDVALSIEGQETSAYKKRSRSSRRSTAKTQEDKDEKKSQDTVKGPVPIKSNVKFSSVGGCESCIEEVCKLLVHMRHPEVFKTLGVTPPRGFLLHGPPGCGKTLLANAIAGELDMPFLKLAATEIVSGVSGESEEKVRDLFTRAVMHSPCVVFIDEIDAITPKRETASKDMERRIVAQLLACMDDLNSNTEARVLVIGATNRPDSLDPAIRRAGRFDREIKMGIPDEKSRLRILEVLCATLKLSPDFSFSTLAKQTPGYVGADLMSLTREAALCAINRIFQDLEGKRKKSEDVTGTEGQLPAQGVVDDNRNSVPEDALIQAKDPPGHTETPAVLDWLHDQPPLSEEQLKSLSVNMEDFENALKLVQPSAKREGFATIPDVTWNDIGALEDIREELTLAILAPVRHPEEFSAYGLSSPPGILLAGPPGCGKTLLAKAVANESGINFISVKGPELLNMYVGESERAVRQVFQRARNSAPCVIFFDELDALCPRRSDSAESGASVRVVNQLLTEMDGLETRKQVFIMAATNRPDIIDPAVIRPGRLDKILHVGLPTQTDRAAILKTITKNGSKPVLQPDVDFELIAAKCEGFSGADLSALVREASVFALKECMNLTLNVQREESSAIQVEQGKIQILGVSMSHFDLAFDKVVPSVSEQDRQAYLKMKLKRQRK